jgi:hypothetical protein
LQTQITDGLALKQDTLTSTSNVLVGSLTSVGDTNTGVGNINTSTVNAENVSVASATGSTKLVVEDTAGSGIAFVRLNSAGNAFQFFAEGSAATIRTNTANSIRLQAARFAGLATSAIVALTVNTDNTCSFGSSVTFADGSTNASDQSIKTVPQDASVDDSLAIPSRILGVWNGELASGL